MPTEFPLVAREGTHHLKDGEPAYAARYFRVMKFHVPGLAAVIDASGSYHIRPDGSPAYESRFIEAFGFYEERASVRDHSGWYHILASGKPAYQERYAWCGNYQESRVTVRNQAGFYFHLDEYGRRTYAEHYLYAGDYRDGIACVRRADGSCLHIDKQGHLVHAFTFGDLDVFHKGYARARDEGGWFHLRQDGRPAYAARFAEVEPYYNGQAFCREWSGRRVIVDHNGEVLHVVWDPDQALQSSQEERGGVTVVVVGNCGVGKTTLAQRLAVHLGLPPFSIDAARREASDGTPAGELRAWQKFLESVRSNSRTGAIIEFSGSGPMAHFVKLTLEKGSNYKVIWLRAPVEVCLSRVASRATSVPYPDFGISITELIPELHARLEKEFSRGDIWPTSRVSSVNAEQSSEAVLARTLKLLPPKGTT